MIDSIPVTRSAGLGATWRLRSPSGRTAALALLCVVVAAPLLAILRYLPVAGDGLFRHLAATVLPDYVRTTLALGTGVAVLAGTVGAGTAWLVTMYRFPGRDLLAWALVLPLAMPAYVLAYAYTDALQVTGPIQTALRAATGWGVHDYLFPEIRSLGGAVLVLSAALYPYVYVLARAAFVEQSQCALEVSRTLGCTPFGTFWRVGLPLARPAIVTGVALAVMEAVADFGAVSFFELPTFTTGIYRAWYALGSPGAAAQLASCLMLAILAILLIERALRGRAGFASGTSHIFQKEARPLGRWRAAATFACALPLLAGFAIPLVILAHMTIGAAAATSATRLAEVTLNTVFLGGTAAVTVTAVALAALLLAKREPSPIKQAMLRAATLGYAAPGAVIGVGIVVAVGAFDNVVNEAWRALGGTGTGLLLGGSVAALVLGYVTRFLAVAYNPLEAGHAKIAQGFIDAARILGCRGDRVFGRVELPLLRPALASALLLVFVDVLKELPATLILRPFDLDTLAVEAYRLATTERLAEAALPSFIIVAAGLLPVILLCRLLARGRARSAGVP